MDSTTRLPQQTARIVLISGGTAMTASARVLKQYTNRSCHFLSPFDSGGSSAEFRRHFALPALGDLRSRLIALANESSELHRQRAACLSQRMAVDESQPIKTLLNWKIQAAGLGQDEPVWNELFETTVRFAKKLPTDFDWSQASLGNLAMAAAMVEATMSLDSVIFHMQELLQCQGQARCIVSDPLHLRVRLRSGREVIGQHRITGKQHQALNEAISDIALCQDSERGAAAACHIDDTTTAILRNASLIVFCPGSFYTSLFAQLLPQGVCEAIASSHAHKVYVPNLGTDPELVGCTPKQALHKLQRQLSGIDQQALAGLPHSLLIDPSQYEDYQDESGLDIRSHNLAQANEQGHHPHRLVEALLTLAEELGLSDL